MLVIVGFTCNNVSIAFEMAFYTKEANYLFTNVNEKKMKRKARQKILLLVKCYYLVPEHLA